MPPTHLPRDAASDDLALAQLLADAADRITRTAFVPGAAVAHRTKADGSPVSDADRAVEEALLAIVRRHRPGDAFLGEEVGAHGEARRRWVVDGIDGTSNFVAGRPLWGTLVALLEDDVPVLGVHTSPGQRSRTWARRGGGAWRAEMADGEVGAPVRLSVASPTGDGRPRANLELAWPRHPRYEDALRIRARVDEVTMTTHPGLMVAAGELDVAVQLGGGPWDVAAFMPMVWEAGGRCVDLEGDAVRTPTLPVVHVGGLDTGTLRRLLTGT